MARGKTKLEIDKVQFQKVVTELERVNKFPNPSALWKAVEQTTWAKAQKPRPLTASVAYARAKELGIVVKTEAGRRTVSPEQVAAMREGRTSRRPRSEKMKVYADSFQSMRRSMPKRFALLIDRAEAGSLRAAINLNCLSCSNYQTKEIKFCNITGCPLFPHRPYQGNTTEEEDIVTEGEEETETADDD
jgi:hypothetical protein